MISTNYAGSCYQGYRVIFTSCTFCERNTLLISSGSLFLFMFTTPSLSWTEWQLCEMCNNSSDVHFALNCYKHHTQLVVRTPDVIAQKTLRCKGVTQGDPFTMVVYGLGPPHPHPPTSVSITRRPSALVRQLLCYQQMVWLHSHIFGTPLFPGALDRLLSWTYQFHIGDRDTQPQTIYLLLW